nr:MipA/OmpV family protein [Burkholderia latens]
MRPSLRSLRYCMPLAGLTLAAIAHAENQYAISLGGGFAPRYQGSNQYRAVVGPSFSAMFGNGFFIDTGVGAGYRLSLPNGAFVSAALGYDAGRADENRFGLPGSDHLKGMGRVPGSVLFGLRAGVKLLDGGELTIAVDAPVTHASRGLSGHVDLAVPIFEAGRHALVATGSVHAGTGRYMQTFYGVTDAQSLASGFRPYSTSGGVDSATLSLAWNWDVSRHWAVRATGGFTRLLGRYGDSPIVQTRSNYYGMAGVTYKF